jgi:hypothetical protein
MIPHDDNKYITTKVTKGTTKNTKFGYDYLMANALPLFRSPTLLIQHVVSHIRDLHWNAAIHLHP